MTIGTIVSLLVIAAIALVAAGPAQAAPRERARGGHGQCPAGLRCRLSGRGHSRRRSNGRRQVDLSSPRRRPHGPGEGRGQAACPANPPGRARSCRRARRRMRIEGRLPGRRGSAARHSVRAARGCGRGVALAVRVRGAGSAPQDFEARARESDGISRRFFAEIAIGGGKVWRRFDPMGPILHTPTVKAPPDFSRDARALHAGAGDFIREDGSASAVDRSESTFEASHQGEKHEEQAHQNGNFGHGCSRDGDRGRIGVRGLAQGPEEQRNDPHRDRQRDSLRLHGHERQGQGRRPRCRQATSSMRSGSRTSSG